MSYSTGEIAELCGVTVRTVQFYDREGLLKPDSHSEGGRRLYGEESLKTLRIITLYKSLGLSLSEIKSVVSDEENSRKILLSVLETRERALDEKLRENIEQKKNVKLIRDYIARGGAIDRDTFIDVRKIMKGRKKLKATHAFMLTVGILMDVAEIAFIVLWAVKGIWLPFAIGMPLVAAAGVGIVIMYYKNVEYACVDCGRKFKPRVREWLFAKHTFRTHKLTCPFCGKNNYHIETFSERVKERKA